MASSVKLIAATKPNIKTDSGETLTASEFIAYVARVSNPSNQSNNLTAPKLLKYLVKNKHFSPFELFNFVFEVNTTRDIGRQILRHRSFNFQEFSGRYSDNVKELGVTVREARLQDTKNRQNSLSVDNEELQNNWVKVQQDIINESKSAYEWAISNGIAKEQARAVLPEGLTNSRIYISSNVRNFIHYCQVRMDKSTQKEHREIAESIWNLIIKEIPDLEGILEN